MLRRRFFSLAGLGAFGQELPQIRVEVNLVNVPFTARDAHGRLVETLTREDIEVLEDGVPQRISHFSPGAGSDLALGLVADASGSQKDFLKDHRRDLRDFLKSVMRARDQAFLVCFGNNLRLVSGLTGNMDQILERLHQYEKRDKNVEFPPIGAREMRLGGSAFYDAVYHAAEDVLGRVAGGRRALIVFSDGEDNASAHHMIDTIEAAQRAGAVVFSVRYTELRNGRWTARNKQGRSVMERIAKETGGIDVDATDARDLKAQFREISDILRASYDLAYSPSNGVRDGEFRKIQIRAKNPGLTFRHKTGYFARAE